MGVLQWYVTFHNDRRISLLKRSGISTEIRLDDPIPQYTYLVNKIVELYPDLAYIHVTEPRIAGDTIRDPKDESNDFIRAIWAPRPLISAGGYDRTLAIEVADTKGDIIAFGRHYIANVRHLCLPLP